MAGFYDVVDGAGEVLVIDAGAAHRWYRQLEQDEKIQPQKTMTTQMNEIPIADVKTRFNAVVKQAEQGPVIVTRHGAPAAAIVGFADEDDYLEWLLVNDPAWRERVKQAYAQIEAGETYSTSEVLSELGLTREDLLSHD